MATTPKLIKHLYEFPPFRLDPQKRLLFRENEPVPLTPKVLETLLVLVENRDRVVTKDELMKLLWPDSFVEESNLSQNIFTLRKALGDSTQERRYILTVPGRGYQFVASVQEIGGAPTIAPTAPTTLPPDSFIGKKVSHYRVLQVLGGGGMGVVYQAEDLKLGRQVALKFLPAEMASDPRAMERMQREARAASALDHPNICAIYELGEHEGQPFIVMQLLQGQTLREWIENSTGEPTNVRVEHLAGIAEQIAQALEAAHQRGIIHRDIKPANIFVTSRGEVKILDFGVAKFMDIAESAEHGEAREGAGIAHTSDLQLSRTGTSMGTPSYLSPEQVNGENLDARTDLFSFGLVLYEMATGKQAFPGQTAAIIREAVLNMPATPIRDTNPELPEKLETIVGHALEKDRNRRYQSASEVLSDLQELRRAVGAEDHSASKKELPIAEQRRAKQVLKWGAAAVLTMSAIGLVVAGLHYRAERAKRLTDQDTIVITDFANSTNDPVFDGTLKQALKVALSQSRFLNIVPENKVRDTLRLMTRAPETAVTVDLAPELCQRSGSKAYVAGAIAALGREYVIGLKAENCLVGETLAEEQVTAKSKDAVIDALGDAAAELRQKLGESISNIRQSDVPLREATTGSLEALKEFTVGGQVENSQGVVAAVPHYEKAIALDPFFARAYVSLATMYFDAGESSLASKYATQAYQLRDRGTEMERLQIDTAYHGFVTGDLQKTAEAYQRLSQLLPKYNGAHANLAYVYGQMGQNEKALAESLTALQLARTGEDYANVISTYVALGRFKEAKATFAEAEAHNLDLPTNHNTMYQIGFIERDASVMDREAKWAEGKTGIEDILLYAQSCTRAYFGDLGKAREFSQKASDLANAAGQKETAAGYRADAALREALFGNAAEAQRRLRTVLNTASGQDVQAAAALAYAFAGDQSRAQSLADSLASKYPQNTIVQYNYLPAIRAQIALNSGNPQRALELLEPARPFELGQPAQALLLNFYPAYVRGSAYLAAHDAQAAAAEFQKMLDHPGVALNEPIAALAHLGIARAKALNGDTQQARSAYDDFLGLWRDANPDIPVLTRAKAEYAKLQ